MKKNKNKYTSFIEAIFCGLPIAVGYIPIAIAFGLLAKTSGVPLLDSFLFSVMVFAGASQFMALNLLVSGVAPLEIILATLLMNFRHLLMSASLSTKITNTNSKWIPVMAFGITDETFSVLATTREKFTTRFAIIVNSTAYLGWVGGTVVGYLGGSILPNSIQNSMNIALYAMFVSILVPEMKKSFQVIFLSIIGGITHAFLSWVLWLPGGWNLICSIIFASFIGIIVLKDTEQKEEAL